MARDRELKKNALVEANKVLIDERQKNKDNAKHELSQEG